MNVGEKITGTIKRITLGKDKDLYFTIEFENFTKATIKRKV